MLPNVPRIVVNIVEFIRTICLFLLNLTISLHRNMEGGNEIDNLAYACPHCNQHKGTDLVTFVDNYNDIVSLFNPRINIWSEHFSTSNGEIIPITKTGKATIKLLKMNDVDLIILRALLSELERFP
jgi:hypothetical protein